MRFIVLMAQLVLSDGELCLRV